MASSRDRSDNGVLYEGARLRAQRRRFRTMATLASCTGALLLLTLIWRDWIEVVLRIDPDRGSGSAELAVVLGLLAATTVLGLATRLEWKRTTGPLVSPATTFVLPGPRP